MKLIRFESNGGPCSTVCTVVICWLLAACGAVEEGFFRLPLWRTGSALQSAVGNNGHGIPTMITRIEYI